MKKFWRPNKNRRSSDYLCQEARPLPWLRFGCLGSNEFIKWLPSVHFATSWYILMVVCNPRHSLHAQSEVQNTSTLRHNIHTSNLSVEIPHLETSLTLLTAKMRRLWAGALTKSSLAVNTAVWSLSPPFGALLNSKPQKQCPHWELARGNVAAKQCTLLSSFSGVRNEEMEMATRNVGEGPAKLIKFGQLRR